MFCMDHAAEYNRGWDYFAGLTAEEAAERAANDAREQGGYRQSTHYQWGGPGDGSRSRDEMHALDVLGLDTDASFDDVKSSWRAMAKANHPDLKPGDNAAAAKFQSVQAAYEVLRQADERKGPPS
jgi:DnaJ-domain-containing protein 1